MISCTEFIPLYSELFKFLEDQYGEAEVMKYWEYISDVYVAPRLGEAVSAHGMAGCYEYWAKSLNEEACDFTMVYDEDNQKFSIDMKHCPSRGKLNELTYMEPYHNYCGHCAVLYSRQLKKYGIVEDKFDYSKVADAMCFESYKMKDE